MHSRHSCCICRGAKPKPQGYRYLRTDEFNEKLREFNWHYTREEANAWIERYQKDFADKTTDGSDNRYWILRNMGRVH